MDIVLDFLKKEEIDSLGNLMKDAFSVNIDNNNILKCFDSGNIRFLCAKVGDVIAGTIMITNDYDPIKNVKSFYLDYVSVHSDYQNQKIGRKLMLEVEKLAKDEGISFIEFTSSSKRIYARKLYLSLGYEMRDTGVFIKRI